MKGYLIKKNYSFPGSSLIVRFLFPQEKTSHFQIFYLQKIDNCLVFRYNKNMEKENIRYNYNGLWKLLIDKKLKKKDLIEGTGLSSSTIAKITSEKPVNLEVLGKICIYLKCNINDIVSFEYEG